MMLFWFPTSYLRTQRALQWWHQRQWIQLGSEAHRIRDGLLQESFTIRRSLELSLVDNIDISAKIGQDWLNKIEKFHHYLEQLSDRLSPVHIEYSLPLAIQYLLELWRTCNPKLNIEMDLPTHWWHEPPDRSIVILRVLDELIRISMSKLLTEISIDITLKLQENIGELVVYIFYPDVSTLISYYSLKDLEYLGQTFEMLTSGQCFREIKELSMAWCFRWVTQKDKFVR